MTGLNHLLEQAADDDEDIIDDNENVPDVISVHIFMIFSILLLVVNI